MTWGFFAGVATIVIGAIVLFLLMTLDDPQGGYVNYDDEDHEDGEDPEDRRR